MTWRKKWIGRSRSFDVEGALSDAGVTQWGRPHCRIPDNTEAKGAVRKFLSSLQPSSSGHKFL